MDVDMTSAEMRRELQALLSEERELVDQVVSATTSGDYARLRDLADKLMKLSERRAALRTALVEARAREAAAQPQATERRGGDQAEDTWRRLR